MSEPRLSLALNKSESKDIIKDNVIRLHTDLPNKKDLEEEAKQKSGPVKTSYNLLDFHQFRGKRYNTTIKPVISITEAGHVRINRLLCDHFFNKAVMIYLNKIGTVLIIQEDEIGFKVRERKTDSENGPIAVIGCKPIATELKSKGVTLPAHFLMEYDKDQKFWIGRRE